MSVLVLRFPFFPHKIRLQPLAKRGIERIVFRFDTFRVRHPFDHPTDVLIRAAVFCENLPGLPCNQRRVELALQFRIVKPDPREHSVFVRERRTFLGGEESPIQQLFEAGESRFTRIRTRARNFEVSYQLVGWYFFLLFLIFLSILSFYLSFYKKYMSRSSHHPLSRLLRHLLSRQLSRFVNYCIHNLHIYN